MFFFIIFLFCIDIVIVSQPLYFQPIATKLFMSGDLAMIDGIVWRGYAYSIIKQITT